ncbi:hypothetical protein [Bartonella elizabethae]|uniref:hypothetical protein n=1 Tax=Bartonella elizabethae TaxID=807 RepID=UPI0002D2D833|nr:hypothetical protein [Bartonella elizabethae]
MSSIDATKDVCLEGHKISLIRITKRSQSCSANGQQPWGVMMAKLIMRHSYGI